MGEEPAWRLLICVLAGEILTAMKYYETKQLPVLSLSAPIHLQNHQYPGRVPLDPVL